MIRCLDFRTSDPSLLAYWLEQNANISQYRLIISKFIFQRCIGIAWHRVFYITGNLDFSAMEQWTPAIKLSISSHFPTKRRPSAAALNQLRKLWSTNSRVLSLDLSFLQGWTWETAFLLAKVWIFQWCSWPWRCWSLATTSLRWAFYHSFPVSGIWTLSKIVLQKSSEFWMPLGWYPNRCTCTQNMSTVDEDVLAPDETDWDLQKKTNLHVTWFPDFSHQYNYCLHEPRSKYPKISREKLNMT